jgi:hypothetical protein
MTIMNTYSEQRKERLADVVNDYLNDQDVTPAEFYFDLKAEVQELIDYHKREAKRAEEFMKLISPIQIQQEL